MTKTTSSQNPEIGQYTELSEEKPADESTHLIKKAPEPKGCCLQGFDILPMCLPFLVVVAAMLCLIIAYARDLGGEVKIQHVDHTPCDLEVEAGSARRISHLIYNEKIQLFYLVLKFPDDVEVKKTENIFRAYTMVWTFGGHQGRQYFLDLPWMYLVWSFGLLDHFTFRNVELKLIVRRKDTCSLVLGSNRTTLAIVTAMKQLAINIKKGDKEIDQDVMYSNWCQTYFEEGINPHFMNLAKLFRFYYSDFRYMCSHLDFNFNSNEYEVIPEKKNRPLTRRWSSLAFALSIVSLWFFPLIFFYFESTSYDQDTIYLGVRGPSTYCKVLQFIFEECSPSLFEYYTNCDCFCNFLFFILFTVGVCPLGIYITSIYLRFDTEAQTMLKELYERKTNRSLLPVNVERFFASDAFPIVFYFIFTIIVYIINYFQKKECERESTKFERYRSCIYCFPWLYIFMKFGTTFNQFKCESTGFSFVVNMFFYQWIFFFLLTLFKSLMPFFMFFSFFILSIVTFPKFISSVITYISIAVLFVIRSVYYLPYQYSKFLALNIDVMTKMKVKCRVNRKGDLGMSKALFSKLVDEHQPVRKMVLKIVFELYFVVAILIWTGLWIRELNQWGELAILKDIIVAGIIYKIPAVFEVFVSNEDNDLVVRRLEKNLRKFFAELYLGMSKACDGIKQAHVVIYKSYRALEQKATKEVRDGIEEAITGINKSCSAIEQARSSLEDSFLDMEQCFDKEIKGITLKQAGGATKQCHICTMINQTYEAIETGLDSINNCPIRTHVQDGPINDREEQTDVKTIEEQTDVKTIEEQTLVKTIEEQTLVKTAEEHSPPRAQKEDKKVSIEIEQVPKTRDPKAGLKKACDGLHLAFESLKHSVEIMKQVHGKQDPHLDCDDTKQDNDSQKKVLTGLQETANRLKQARSSIENLLRDNPEGQDSML